MLLLKKIQKNHTMIGTADNNKRRHQLASSIFDNDDVLIEPENWHYTDIDIFKNKKELAQWLQVVCYRSDFIDKKPKILNDSKDWDKKQFDEVLHNINNFMDQSYEDSKREKKEKKAKLKVVNDDPSSMVRDNGFWINDGKRDIPAINEMCDYFNALHNTIYIIDTGNFMRFDGKKYEVFYDEEVKAFAYKNSSPKWKDKERKEFLNTLRLINQKSKQDFDGSIKGKINLQNCVYDFNTKDIHMHSPEFGFTYCLPFDYDCNAECPLWDEVQDNVFLGNKELSQIYNEYVGCALAGHPNSEVEKVVILCGDGSNGKSTIMDVTGYVFGPEAKSALTLSELNNKNRRDKLSRALLNMSDESNPDSLVQSELLKTIATGGTISAEQKFKPAFEFESNTKIIAACNEYPRITDRSDGTIRRLITIPFNAKFEKKAGNRDSKIREKLKKELPGIFNKFLKAYFEYVKRGDFLESEVVQDELDLIRVINDNTYEFFDEFLEAGAPDDWVNKKAVYAKYQSWVDEKGNAKEMGQTKFWSLVRKHAGLRESKWAKRARKNINGIEVYIQLGVREKRET